MCCNRSGIGKVHMMNLYENIKNGSDKIAVTGMGYVGMPIAVSFAKCAGVIGFDVNRDKIKLYQEGVDPTNEVGDDGVASSKVEFTFDEAKLKEARFHIIAVPTPINKDKTPDLTPVEEASRTVGRNLQKGSIVVYESTVYPGVTEDVCVPILESSSGLSCGSDFKVAYSPERINPGDKEHRLENIVKIVSGMDGETLEEVAKVYGMVVKAGVYKAESIKVAEAAKVIENSQRDINIAFMNELALIFHRLGINTKAVLEAAGTKWNFLNFQPGLVGGHCIGVDPYYLTYKAEQTGYHSQIILSGRRINDDMGREIARELVKTLIRGDRKVKGARVAVLGFTFKENCPDIRNTRVIDIVNELRAYGIEPVVVDPVAEDGAIRKEYDVEIEMDLSSVRDMDAVVFAVAHDEFRRLPLQTIEGFFPSSHERPKIVFDVKGVLDRGLFGGGKGFVYWSL